LLLASPGFANPSQESPGHLPPIQFAEDIAPACRTLIEQAVQQHFGQPAHRPATVSLAVVDGRTSRPLVQMRSEERLIPASVTKAFTTGHALETLGPDFRFSTQLLAGVDQLILRGGFDPTLGSDRVPGSATSATVLRELADAVSARVRSLPPERTVQFTLAPELLAEPIPGPWDWEDLGDYYGAGVHRLNWHDNLFVARFDAGPTVGSPARLSPGSVDPGWMVRNEVRTGPAGSGDRATFRLVMGRQALLARGTIPAGETGFAVRGTLPEPGKVLVQLVRDLMPSELSRRVVWREDPTTESDRSSTGTVIWSRESPPLSEIIGIIHRQSFNMYAEAVLLATLIHGSRETVRAALPPLDGYGEAARLRGEWLSSLGLEVRSLRLRDGSGLSMSNRVSALETARYFAVMSQRPLARIWRSHLAMHGEDGDLARRKDRAGRLRGRVRAKTGLLTGTRTLAGLMELENGHSVAFAILVQGSDSPWTKTDLDMDEVLSAIALALAPTR
jgi:D-alanyl-D-alanine carboxypeptidase/D-alanyl-D-alanine-endopeptidase (penicillin-binding protein 4)